MKRLSIALALAGLSIGAVLVGWFGLDAILAAIRDVSPGEFLLIMAWQGVIFVILGLAWYAILSKAAVPPWVPVWARMVRDASATCLPFSQLGGFVFGTRAAVLSGLRWPVATASMVVDLTAEFLAQIAFVAIGLTILIAHAPASHLVLPLQLGLGIAVLGGVGFVAAQRGAGPVFAALGRRIAGDRFGGTQDRVDALHAELAALHAHPGRLAAAFLLHLLGWLATGCAGWLTLHMLGVPIGIGDALAIEALLAAVAALAFLVPAAIGVQEAGYVGLGALFGVPAEMAIATSLIRRARDLAIGVPILLAWQIVEVRRLRGPAAAD